jgi:hypothetical protein
MTSKSALSVIFCVRPPTSLWAEQGLVFEQSFREWDNGLVHRHSAISGEVSDLYHVNPPVVRGRLIYRRCATLEPPLEGRSVPLHFVHGSFNALANDVRLGWHPDYKTLLEEDDQ